MTDPRQIRMVRGSFWLAGSGPGDLPWRFWATARVPFCS